MPKFVHHKLMGRLSEAMLVLLAALHMMLPLTQAVTCKKAKQQLPNRTVSPDRKYSVVLYGVEECPQEKHARLQSDLKHAVSVMSNVDNTICYESIKHCYCLGK